jgi:predicted ferric reductase
MSPNQNAISDDTRQPAMSWPWLLASLVGIFALTLLVTVFLPDLAPRLASSLVGENPKAYWYLSRGSAIVAYLLLWASMAFGLLITNKMARAWPGGPAAFELHEYVSLLGLGFALFHGLILMGDQFIHYNLAQVLLPFGSYGFKPFWVGLGQLSFYLSAVLVASFYVRKRIGNQTWRILHFASFGAFLFAMVHGLMSGTDTASSWMQAIYWLSAASLVFLIVYRVLVSRYMPARRPAGQPVRKPANDGVV